MKAEHILVTTGLMAVLFAGALSLIPGSPISFSEESVHAMFKTAPAADVQWNKPSRPGVTAVPAAARTLKAQPGVMDFENAPLRTAAGVIQQISESSGADGQIHIWIEDPATKQEQWVSVGPSWFLQYMGCNLTHDSQVQVKGFVFDSTTAQDKILYAKKIVVNGTTCQLRNDEGFALWSNQLR